MMGAKNLNKLVHVTEFVNGFVFAGLITQMVEFSHVSYTLALLQVAWLPGSYLACKQVGSGLAGKIASKVSEGPLASGALFLKGLALFLAIQSPSFTGFAVGIIAIAFLSGIIQTTSNALVLKTRDEKKGSSFISLQYIIMNLGGLGGLLSGLSAEASLMPWFFSGCGLLILVNGIALGWYVRKHHAELSHADLKELGHIRKPLTTNTSLWLMIFAVSTLYLMYFSFVPSILLHHQMPFKMGYLEFINSILILVMQPFLIKRIAQLNATGQIKNIAFGSLLILTAFVGLLWTQSLWLLLVLFVIFSFGEIICFVPIQNIVNMSAPKNEKTTYFGLFKLTFGTGSLASTALASSLFIPSLTTGAKIEPTLSLFGFLGLATCSLIFLTKRFRSSESLSAPQPK